MTTQGCWKSACEKRGPRAELGNSTCAGGTTQKQCHLTVPSHPGGETPRSSTQPRVEWSSQHTPTGCCIRVHTSTLAYILGWADTLLQRHRRPHSWPSGARRDAGLSGLGQRCAGSQRRQVMKDAHMLEPLAPWVLM